MRGDVDAHYHPTILSGLEYIALGEGETIEKNQSILAELWAQNPEHMISNIGAIIETRAIVHFENPV